MSKTDKAHENGGSGSDSLHFGPNLEATSEPSETNLTESHPDSGDEGDKHRKELHPLEVDYAKSSRFVYIPESGTFQGPLAPALDRPT